MRRFTVILAFLSSVLLLASLTPASALAVCGSRGGPGVRLASGKCASWSQVGGYSSDSTSTTDSTPSYSPIVLPPMVPAVVAPQSLLPDAAAGTNCQFVLGFKALREMAPIAVGQCLDDQAFAPNGDAQQHSTKGLMAWRKADNWTAFTDGYQTWLNGPTGLAKRLNTDRFSWEGDASSAGVAPATSTINAPTTAPATSSAATAPSFGYTTAPPVAAATPSLAGNVPPAYAPPPGYTVDSTGRLITPSGNLSAEAPPGPNIPAGATGKCKDGTYSFATHHQGMCSSHGGVAQFYS